MGVTGSTSGIGIGFISNSAIIDLQLSAMESSGNGEIVSQMVDALASSGDEGRSKLRKSSGSGFIVTGKQIGRAHV